MQNLIEETSAAAGKDAANTTNVSTTNQSMWKSADSAAQPQKHHQRPHDPMTLIEEETKQ